MMNTQSFDIKRLGIGYILLVVFIFIDMHSSTRYLIIATILLFCGAAFPFLMVIRVIQPSFWLSFLSYGCSIVGIMLGMYGVTGTVIRRNQKDEWEDWRDL